MRRSGFIIGFLLVAIHTVMATTDEVYFVQQDSSVFRGSLYTGLNSSDALYWGVLKSRDFSTFRGCFKLEDEELHMMYLRMTNGVEDTTFANLLQVKVFQRECYTSEAYILDEINVDSSQPSRYDRIKRYNYATNRWTIGMFKKDGEYKWGRSYDSDQLTLFDITDNRYREIAMWALCFFIMMAFSLWILFSPFFDLEDKTSLRLILGWTIFIGSVLAVCLVPKFIQLQLTLPFFSLVLVYGAMYYLKPKKLQWRIILNTVCCVTVILFWTYIQFYRLDDTTKLSDGTEVQLHWKKGTAVLKRHVIHRMLNRMIPIAVQDHGREYTVYVSKYEFSTAELDVLNDDVCSWISYLMNDSPVDDLSYRESQIVLQRIHQLCDVPFDFLSYNEWLSASMHQPHAPHYSELCDVNEGDMNSLGLVHIASNVPEYTSNYIWSYRISNAADTLLKAYNKMVVAGSAYLCDDSILCSEVNKNLRQGGVGFRVVYRPNGIGARQFQIHGICRSDRAYRNLPQFIQLVAIDGISLTSLDNYESFEELLVEKRHSLRTIEAIDLSTMQRVQFDEKQGADSYDYEPIFSFR